jgi:aspartyl-tRNA synthetase
MAFLVIRDATGRTQCVVDRRTQPELANVVASLTRESVVGVSGTVVAGPDPGAIEIQAQAVVIYSRSTPSPPIDPASLDQPGVETWMDWRYLDLRRPANRLIFEIQTEIEWAMRQHWKEHAFIEIHTPKLMATASESGVELFEVGYFGEKAYLAQSPQFYKQMAMASGFDRVFEIAPVFRANPSFTSRHDTEFTSVDVEMSWIDSHDDVMQFEEHWLTAVLTHVSETYADRTASNFGTKVVVPELPFPRIPMAQAQQIVSDSGHRNERDGDLDPAGERILSEHIQNEFGHEFAFVVDYPVAVRPFYHMRMEDDPGLTKSFDLLWKGLEVTTGTQREHRLDRLEAQAVECGLTPDHIRFYLDFFKFGCPAHGGFGFGLTRMLMVLLGLPAVRETTFLTRTPRRLTP